jgi:hypothetical protein
MAAGAFTFAVPRGKRYDDTNGVPDSLVVWRGLDPSRGWNAANYNRQAPRNKIHFQALRTEELSTAASDRIALAKLRAPGEIFDGWKMAEFTVGEARQAGYIAMRDPTNPTDVVFYIARDPDNPHTPKTEPKALANLARIV